MIRATREIEILAFSIETILQKHAKDRLRMTRTLTDENERDALFDDAAELRRIAEFAATIRQIAEGMSELQRPLSTREREGITRRRPFRIVGGGA